MSIDRADGSTEHEQTPDPVLACERPSCHAQTGTQLVKGHNNEVLILCRPCQKAFLGVSS